MLFCYDTMCICVLLFVTELNVYIFFKSLGRQNICNGLTFILVSACLLHLRIQ